MCLLIFEPMLHFFEVIKSLWEDESEAEDPASKTWTNEEDLDPETPTNDSSSPFWSSMPMPAVGPNELVGTLFLLNKESDQILGNQFVRALDYFQGNLARDSSGLKFVFMMNDDAIENIFTHN